MSVTLAQLRESGLVRQILGDEGTHVSGVRHDSRAIEPGDLFVAMRGGSADGARFVEAALARGAAAVLADRPLEVGAPLVLVEDARRAFAPIAELVYGQPSRAIPVIGVTGTNGKTTTTWITEEALAAVGARPALIGTVELRGPGGYREVAAFTTPEADATSRFLRSMIDRGASHLVMEVSSHALAQHRCDALRFDVAVFTNLTQDHLDFHATMDAYYEAKARLFLELAPRVSIVRIDDPWGARLAREVSDAILGDPHRSLIRVSRDPASAADVCPLSAWSSGRDGITAEITTPWGSFRLRSRLVGAHNLDNLLFAAATLGALGIAPDTIARALTAVRGAPGRLERVEAPNDVAVLVDYAHSPDALASALAALRPLTPGRLIAVFGCGGDRDRLKRPLMGRIAGENADVVVITSDNPRTEVPSAILDEIVPGTVSSGMQPLDRQRLASATRGFVAEVDRREAIGLAIRAARPGDTVLIAGKGHEDYQILGTQKVHFDDREEARLAIAGLARGASAQGGL
ncbi:MAG: UDP-N-acetylmuramoyl-L-alanyl-D-glutamate--2,6-diaminopimelate ligase [Sandaracinus sp.]